MYPRVFYILLVALVLPLAHCQCEKGQYFDTTSDECKSCPEGCKECLDADLCLVCASATMEHVEETATKKFCRCPQFTYFDTKGSTCRGCLSECEKCSNYFSCDLFKTCPHAGMTQKPDKTCEWTCAAGSNVAGSCVDCTLSDCEVCGTPASGTGEHCFKCKAGKMLDLTDYTCKDACPATTFEITTSTTHSWKGTEIKYCRPMEGGVADKFEYWTNSESPHNVEFGTKEYPFKQMDSAPAEIAMFMFSDKVDFTQYYSRGKKYKMYYGVAPIVTVNIGVYYQKPDPTEDVNLPKPRVMIDEHAYVWPPSTQFTIAQDKLDLSGRVARKDMDTAEAEKFFLKYNLFRSSMVVDNMEYQSIHFGSAWSNPLFFSFDNTNEEVKLFNSYFDLDGSIYEAYFPVGLLIQDSTINITNYEYGVWNDFRWDCVENKAEDIIGYLIVKGTRFIGHFEQALYNFFYFSSPGDSIFENNVFDDFQYLDIETRPFVDWHPQSKCDPPNRTQQLLINDNKFLNLNQPNIIFSLNYKTKYFGPRIFSMQRNFYKDSQINRNLVTLEISTENSMDVTVADNYYENVEVTKDRRIFYFKSALSDISITNEKVKSCNMNDLYTIAEAKDITIHNFTITQTTNTDAITETSSIIRILKANGLVKVTDFNVDNSIFNYGKAFEIESAAQLDFTASKFTDNTLKNANFLVFNSVKLSYVADLIFLDFKKVSDKSRFAISMPTLSLQKPNPPIADKVEFLVEKISFTKSQSSFLEINQVNLVDSADTAKYDLIIRDCTLEDNNLSSKDSLMVLGEINYKNFMILVKDISFQRNSLGLGQLMYLNLNCQLLVTTCIVKNNGGQFVSLEPALTDISNPLVMDIEHTNFDHNSANSDAIIKLTTNSILKIYKSNFKNNYSLGRGSVLFADYQKVQATFLDCEIMNNYAYQGGVFYVQYSSVVTVSSCQIQNNFALSGGVAYINNDGGINFKNNTIITHNTAINTCFLFLINSHTQSEILETEIGFNDQTQALIDKSQFSSFDTTGADTIGFLKNPYVKAMQNLGNKLARVVQDSTDLSIYAIKARLKIHSQTDIHDNELFLAASTESYIDIMDSTYQNIVIDSPPIKAVSSTITMKNFILQNVTPKPGFSSTFSLFQIVNQSTLKMDATTIKKTVYQVIYSTDSVIEMINNTTISETSMGYQSNSKFALDGVTWKMRDSSLLNILEDVSPTIVSCVDCTIDWQRVEVNNFNKQFFDIEGGTYTFVDVVFINGRVESSGGSPIISSSIVFEVVKANINLDKVLITGMDTLYQSPAIYMENDPRSSTMFVLNIRNTIISKNTAQQNIGAIHAKNINVQIHNSQIIDNEALKGNAGAMYFECETAATFVCSCEVTKSTFSGNKAAAKGGNGGAIQYNFYEPDITDPDNVFENNVAEFGPTLAGYASFLILKSNPPSDKKVISPHEILEPAQITAKGAEYKIDTSGITDQIVIDLNQDFVSGQVMNTSIIFNLETVKEETVITDDESFASISSTSESIQVMKSKTVRATDGVFNFNDVILIGEPKNMALLKLQSAAVDPAVNLKAFNKQTPDIYMLAYLRSCQPGEQMTKDNKCVVCQEGLYSLTIGADECKSCPEFAQCKNGKDINVTKGYWRVSNTSVDIFECFNIASCLGGIIDLANGVTTCEVGYEGNLCHGCGKVGDQWYTRESSHTCSVCPSKTWNAARLALVTVMVLVYVIILIVINVKSQGGQRLTTVYMRILTNYFQILTLAQSYDLDWSDNVKTLLQTVSFIGKGSEIILSIDCFLRDNGFVLYPLYVKVLLCFLVPIGVVFICIPLAAIATCFKRDTTFIRNYIVCFIVLIFVVLPPITSITFAVYNCIDVFNNGSKYLAIDVNNQCWEGDHKFYAINIGIPSVIFWILGLPIIAFIVLFKKRKRLMEPVELSTWGFLYMGLKSKAFYWEILLHFRKVGMTCINVFFTTFKPLYKALIGFMLMIIYIEVLQKVEPFLNAEINELELKANLAAFTTFYGGLFFISDQMPESVSWVLLVIIVGINLIFFYAWFKLTFAALHARFAKYFPCCKKKPTIQAITDAKRDPEAAYADNGNGPAEFEKGQNDKVEAGAAKGSKKKSKKKRSSSSESDKHKKKSKKKKTKPDQSGAHLLDDSSFQPSPAMHQPIVGLEMGETAGKPIEKKASSDSPEDDSSSSNQGVFKVDPKKAHTTNSGKPSGSSSDQDKQKHKKSKSKDKKQQSEDEEAVPETTKKEKKHKKEKDSSDKKKPKEEAKHYPDIESVPSKDMAMTAKEVPKEKSKKKNNYVEQLDESSSAPEPKPEPKREHKSRERGEKSKEREKSRPRDEEKTDKKRDKSRDDRHHEKSRERREDKHEEDKKDREKSRDRGEKSRERKRSEEKKKEHKRRRDDSDDKPRKEAPKSKSRDRKGVEVSDAGVSDSINSNPRTHKDKKKDKKAKKDRKEKSKARESDS